VSAPGGPLVKPGTSCTITAEIAATVTKSYEGAFKKVINIETNDPQTPLVSLTVTAYIYAPLQVEPRSLVLDGVTLGSPPRGQEFLIRNRSPQPITITQIAVSPAGFATIAPQGDKSIVLKPGQALKLAVTFSPTLPLGYNYGRVTLHTDWQKLPEKAIPFRVQMVPAKR
jgi:hypothetical protein